MHKRNQMLPVGYLFDKLHIVRELNDKDPSMLSLHFQGTLEEQYISLTTFLMRRSTDKNGKHYNNGNMDGRGDLLRRLC